MDSRSAGACLSAFLFLAPTAMAQTASPFGDAAANALARLMKIEPAPPAVSVTVLKRSEEDGLIVEDILWPSNYDGEAVPAFVIRPANAAGKLPAVVCLHGSGGSRESMTTAQFGIGEWTTPGQQRSHQRMLGWARELARRGYLTLSLTQRGLDRRMPSSHDQSKDTLVRGRTMMGVIVDEIRQGVTHLRERPDVDAARIGMTGLSFGGITTFYTWVTDARIAAAAPICGGVGSVDLFLKKGNRGYHGFYWWIPDMLTVGDHGEFTAAMAPRPLMVWAPTEDVGMVREGVDLLVRQAGPAYEKAGAAGNLVVHQPPGEHAFTMPAFEALTAFLSRHLGGGR